MDNFVFGQGSISKLENVEDIMVRLCYRALKESTVDFSIISGFRSKDEQAILYSEGKTEMDGITNISAHQMGIAVDVLPYEVDSSGSTLDCWNYNDPKVRVAWYEVHIAFLRAAMLMGLNIELGVAYDINGVRDYPHIEIKL